MVVFESEKERIKAALKHQIACVYELIDCLDCEAGVPNINVKSTKYGVKIIISTQSLQ